MYAFAESVGPFDRRTLNRSPTNHTHKEAASPVPSSMEPFERTCWICSLNDEEEPLHVVCNCVAHMQYAHLHCIQRKVNNTAKNTCEWCDFEYCGHYKVINTLLWLFQ